jgi:phenylpyruvate tautomerase PptA (4-oxalocrotonate tautomerase family)
VGFRPIRRAAWASALLLSLSSHAAAEPVDAATRAAARDLGYAGVAAYQAGDYATASAKLEKAYAALQAPSLGLWSARALARLNKLVEAAERYIDVTRLDASSGEAAVHEQAKKDARAEHAILVPKIPKLIVKVAGVDPAEVSVTIDEVPMANALIGEQRPVNPGPHVVRGKRGDEVVEGRVTLPQGAEESVQLVFKGGPLPAGATAAAAADPTDPSQPNAAPAPAPVDQPRGGGTARTLGWISLVAGAAGVVTGGATGIVALDWKSQIENDEELYNASNMDRYETLRTISIASLITGGVLATTGIVLLVVAPSSSAKAPSGTFVALDVGPGSVGVRGKF